MPVPFAIYPYISAYICSLRPGCIGSSATAARNCGGGCVLRWMIRISPFRQRNASSPPNLACCRGILGSRFSAPVPGYKIAWFQGSICLHGPITSPQADRLLHGPLLAGRAIRGIKAVALIRGSKVSKELRTNSPFHHKVGVRLSCFFFSLSSILSLCSSPQIRSPTRILPMCLEPT